MVSLDDGSRYAHWSLSLYPDAGEGGGAFVPSLQNRYRGVRGSAAEPDRAREEAARRARGNVRRYCAANGLNRFGTLTYGPPFCTDYAQLREDVARFFRRLRRALGGDPLPYLWVAELHKDGRRFHAHYAMGRYVNRSVIEQAWGHGFIKVKLISDLPVGAGSWEESRIAARYLAKYVSKTFEHAVFGRHRYERSQGFTPVVERFTATSLDTLVEQAVQRMGRAPAYRWSSNELPEWKAPPALWMSWS